MINKFWNEPDVWEDWIDGLLCCARRNSMKSWCGYVRVRANHPATAMVDNLSVHGGITWDQDRLPWASSGSETFFWLGFDCSHSEDLSPYQVFRGGDFLEATYRDLEFVKNNIIDLVGQIKELEK